MKRNVLERKMVAGMLAMAVMACLATPMVAQAADTAAGNTININTASVEEMCQVPGVGTVKAQAIVSYREAHGLFNSVDDLLVVRGIGVRLLEKIRHRLTV